MGEIIKFPANVAYATLHAPGGSPYTVSVRIIDRERPEEARWHLQFAMQRAASFRCLLGFTDEVARSGRRHFFNVNRQRLLRRFLIDIERLVVEGRVSVHVDGVRVRIGTRKVA